MIRFLQDQDSLDDRFFFRAFVNTPKYSSIPKVTRTKEQVRKKSSIQGYMENNYTVIYIASSVHQCFALRLF